MKHPLLNKTKMMRLEIKGPKLFVYCKVDYLTAVRIVIVCLSSRGAARLKSGRDDPRDGHFKKRKP